MSQNLLPSYVVPERDAETHVRQQDDEDEGGKRWRLEDVEGHDGFTSVVLLP